MAMAPGYTRNGARLVQPIHLKHAESRLDFSTACAQSG